MINFLGSHVCFEFGQRDVAMGFVLRRALPLLLAQPAQEL